jgi:hypothetical protein
MRKLAVVLLVLWSACLFAQTTIGDPVGIGSTTIGDGLPDFSISTAALRSGQAGVNYFDSIAVSGGISPISFCPVPADCIAPPSGLTLNLDGTVTGIPTVSGDFSFTVIAVDSSTPPRTDSQQISIHIDPAPNPLAFENTTVPPGQTSGLYSTQLLAKGGTPPYTFAPESGSYPPGINPIASDGTIAGTPTTPGSYAFVVRLTDAALTSITQSFILTISTVTTSGTENKYCGIGDVPAFGGPDGLANPLTQCFYTGLDGTPATTRIGGGAHTIFDAPDAASFTSALASAQCGDQIVLHSGTTYTGHFTLPSQNCDAAHWIWIRSDKVQADGTPVALSGFPSATTRANPCHINQATAPGYETYTCGSPAQRMPTLVTPDHAKVLTVGANSNFIRMIGLELAKTPGVYSAKLADFGGDGAGDHILFDRGIIHGSPNPTWDQNDETQGCATVNGFYVGFIYSWCYDTMVTGPTGHFGPDSNGLTAGASGVSFHGPIKIYDSLVASSGESWLFGGGPSAVGAHDIEIRRVHSMKPLSWFLAVGGSGQHPVIKNLGECKFCTRVLYEGLVVENNWTGWQGDQPGQALLNTPKNQSSFDTFTASVAGTTITKLSGSGTFTPTDVSVRVPAGGPFFSVAQFISSTQVKVATAPGDTASVQVKVCHLGQAPNATVTDMVIRYSIIRHATQATGAGTAQSDCGDEAKGIHRVTMHDVVMDDINGPSYSNATNPCCKGGKGFNMGNDHANPLAWPEGITVKHNTFVGKGFSGGDGGMLTVNDLQGNNPITYFKNITWTDNIGSAPISIRGANTSEFTGGLAVQLQGNMCTPPGQPSGGTCTWTVAGNLMVGNVFSGQKVTTKPLPSSNSSCGPGNLTCEPSVTGLFVNFNNGNGGDYHLASSSPYRGQATDAAARFAAGLSTDPGADMDAIATYTNGVASPASGPPPTPDVHVSPSSFDYGTVTVGSTKPNTFTITNTGGASATVSAVALTTGTVFTKTGTTCAAVPFALAINASCTVTVTYAPAAAVVSTDTLTVTDTVGGHTAALTGTGQAVAAPIVSLNPPSLNLGSWLVNQTSTAQTVTLQNTGNAPLTLSPPSTISGDFARTTSCGASLAANGSCTYSITCTPTVSGLRTGTLTINHSADNNGAIVHTVPLQCTGTTQTGGPVTIYPNSYTMPQQTRLPLMCDPSPCTYTFLGAALGSTLDSKGTLTAGTTPGIIHVTAHSGTNTATADITISAALPAVSGDCASGFPYPHSGTTPNQCSFTHQELVGTATRYFNVVIPTNGFNANTKLVVLVGSTGHGVANWCDTPALQLAGSELTGWGPWLLDLPLNFPNAILLCV